MNKRVLRRLVPRHWNKRAFTLADFEFFCALDGVRVFYVEMEREGFYCVFDNVPCIFISRAVPAAKRPWIAFHELAHHWLHAPGVYWFSGFHEKADADADIVAACALLPKHIIQARPPQEIVEEFGYPSELVELRLAIYERHRF